MNTAKLASIFLSITLLLSISSNTFADEVIDVQKFSLEQNKDFNFRYGSSMAFKKSSPYGGGIKRFYLLPGGEFTISNGGDARESTDIPHLAVAKLKKEKFIVKDRFPIFFKEDQTLKVDLEGVAAAPDGSLWFVDEGSNGVFNLDTETGEVKRALTVGVELPLELSLAEANRGLESIAIDPDGNLFFALQSPLSDSEGNQESFIRLYKYDKSNQEVSVYLIPYNTSEYQSADEVKIGDLTVVEKNKFLLIEQGLGKQGELNRVFLIDLHNAETLEPQNAKDFKVVNSLNDAQVVQKKLLIDLRSEGWPYRKAEGLTLIDAATVGVINDWDDEAQITSSELWLFTLKEPLISWGILEWTMLFALLFIFIVSTIVFCMMIFKKKEQ